jgi:hypothetical protein
MRPKLLWAAPLLGALLLITAVGSVAAVAPASAAAKTQHAVSQAIPIPPAGWHPQVIARPWLNPYAITTIQTLSPAACAKLNAAHPGAAPGCKVRDYFLKTGGSHQPLPAGTRFTKGSKAVSASSPPYYYWGQYSYTQCSYTFGCNGWNTHLQIDGVANNVHVYQWNVYCTAGGNLIGNVCTWPAPGQSGGYLYNGGTYNSECGCTAMQFGDDSTASGTIAGTSVTAESGQRVWVSDEGVGFDYWNYGGKP